MEIDPETRAYIETMPQEQQAAVIMMLALGEHFTPEGDSSPNVPPDAVIKGCTLLIAGIIESMPATETTKALRETIDTAANGLKKAAREMRNTYEVDGRRGLEQIGLTHRWERGN